MGFLEKVINRVEKRINPQQYFFEIKQKAQIELIQKAGGDDVAGVWIDANGRRFDELMNDPEYNFIERLVDEETHADALKEIDSKLYH
ncbi:MAG: hypothetical protein HY228_02405 [Candidatus Yonathbacteria bacterium]|nr:hypothetical protein [Candidatus Yonathbacteria bacterium]